VNGPPRTVDTPDGADGSVAPIRVGVYVDGFNLYYGGKHLCPSDASWKWLDIRSLVANIVSRHWPSANIHRLVYCTARVKGRPSSQARQDRYLSTLIAGQIVDEIAYGHFQVSRKESRAATGRRHKWTEADPVRMQQDPLPNEPWIRLDPDGYVLVEHRKREEKGSDVNLASHILIDIYEHDVDAIIVVTNDSDLKFPVDHARNLVPVGIINPRGNRTALSGDADTGPGRHWWHQLTAAELLANPLPDEVARYGRPHEWT